MTGTGTVDEAFRRQVALAPRATAVSCEGVHVSYAELDGQVELWARALAPLGPEAVVGVLAERGVDLIAALLGVLRAGAAYLPLDPRDPPARHGELLGRAGARALVVAPPFAPAAKDHGLPLFWTPEDLSVTALPRVEGRNLAYVLFTSGSTGRPKGVLLEHEGLSNHLVAMVDALALGPQDALAQTASQAFDLSIWQMLGVLVVGGRTVVLPDAVANQPSALLRALEDSKVTVAELVPSVLQAACVAAARKGDRRPPLGALRWMLSTGEALPKTLCEEWLALYPRVPLVNAYGPTECSDDVALSFLPEPPEGAVPIGHPILDVQVHVLDEQLQPSREGGLYVGGAGVGRGYVSDPARTAEVFVPDPFSAFPGARMYCTGDRVRRGADGALEFLGRGDQQIKLRGRRVELGEVEAALASHPAVREAVVTAVTTAAKEVYLAGYVTLREPVPIEALLAHVAARLPPALVPSALIPLEQLPTAPSGKVDRRRLPHPDGPAAQ